MKICSVCRQEKKTRYIDLYVIGSEGLNLCHDCEMRVNESVRQLIYKELDKSRNQTMVRTNTDGHDV